jgi:glycosyltransferase involved in cell wall biosynthesis
MLATLGGIEQAGFTPVVACPDGGLLADALAARGIECVCWRLHDSLDTRLPQARLRAELAEILGRRRSDLVHANSLSMGRLSGPVAAELGLPSIAHLRDIIRLSDRAVCDLNRHTRLLAVSEAVRRYHLAGGLAAGKTHVLHNGVDLDRFCPRAPSGYLHRELGIPPDSPLVGSVGQISLRKGQDVLVATAARLAERLPRVHYLVVGERHSQKDESRWFERALRAAADARPLAGRFHLLGYRHDVAELLGELTLLVHTARQEPLGRVLLESAAAGLPVIASDVGGTREVFPPGSGSARLVPAEDIGAVAAAILELLHNADLRSQMGAAARRRAEQAFDARRATAGLITHYRELI